MQVVFTRGKCAGLCRNKTIEMALNCLPSDPNIRKEWINFILNENPDLVSKNLVLCSLHFSMHLFTNKAQLDAGFSERLKKNAVPTILDSTVMSQHTSVSNCFYYMVTIALSLLTGCLIFIELFMQF